MNMWFAAAAPSPPPEPQPEEWLEPCVIAGLIGVGDAYVRTLIRRGIARGLPGFEKRGGRLFATADAVRAIRAA